MQAIVTAQVPSSPSSYAGLLVNWLALGHRQPRCLQKARCARTPPCHAIVLGCREACRTWQALPAPLAAEAVLGRGGQAARRVVAGLSDVLLLAESLDSSGWVDTTLRRSLRHPPAGS